jgi:uncharacterized protein with HEPN domain
MIDGFTANMDFEAFIEDPKTVSAVERQLQIVSEAAIRLGSEAERRIPAPGFCFAQRNLLTCGRK